jgi:lipooligosaccharide transport system permease protein
VATTTRASIGAAAFLLIATILGAVSSPWAIAAIPAAGLCAAAFAAPLTAFTATQDTDLQFPVIMRIVVMPLFLFSGTFFPVAQLPLGLRIAARFSPLWHGVELCRAATTGTLALGAAAIHVSVLVGCIVFGAAWGHRTFTRRLTP